MLCPLCGSANIHVECCGSSAAQCKDCGLRWDTGSPSPCPVPPAMRPGVFDGDEVEAELADMRKEKPDAGYWPAKPIRDGAIEYKLPPEDGPLTDLPISDGDLWGEA